MKPKYVLYICVWCVFMARMSGRLFSLKIVGNVKYMISYGRRI